MKPTIPFVEMMVTQVCNLSCRGCSTYSDLPYSGYTEWSKGKQQLIPWLDIVNFRDFGLMGGEPLINPEIKQWVQGLRNLMPNTQIRLPTNGLLLLKHKDVVDLLHDVGNSILKITVHANDKKVSDAIKWIENRFSWEPVTEYGIKRWKTTNNMRFQINYPKTFNKTFKNDYASAMPYNSDPDDAFDFCHQKLCPLLHNGRIYKCSTSGLMNLVLEKFKYPNFENWKPYLDNTKNGSIGLDSKIQEIQQFIENVGSSHSICRQCPTKSSAEIFNHSITVIKK